jgi:integrase
MAAKKGWDTLSEAKIGKYLERWPIGTRQHLAMTVLLYTGQRRGDAVKLGPHSVVGGKFDRDHLTGRSIEVRQNKTGKELEIPLTPQLAAALKACNIAADASASILTERGKPYTAKSFTGKFSAWGRSAGIETQSRPHMLRFAAARRLAELGLSLKVIASIRDTTA